MIRLNFKPFKLSSPVVLRDESNELVPSIEEIDSQIVTTAQDIYQPDSKVEESSSQLYGTR